MYVYIYMYIYIYVYIYMYIYMLYVHIPRPRIQQFFCALSCINKIWTKHLQPIRFAQNGTQKKNLKVPCEHSSVSRKLDCVRVFSPPGLQKKIARSQVDSNCREVREAYGPITTKWALTLRTIPVSKYSQ